jgi:LysR family transcriptional activator of nhaA
MQWLNYHHLHYFYVIATEGGVTAASKKLKLAQSTLSTQLGQFEDAIGYALFERKKRKLALTEVGQKVLDYAHEIFSLGNELRESLLDKSAISGSIKIGVMDSVPKKISRKLFSFLNSSNPTKVHFLEESFAQLSDHLESHEIDLILANDKPAIEGKTSKFHARLIGELKVVFVARPQMASLAEDIPRSLSGQPMVLPGENNPLRYELLEHFKIKHINPKVIAEVNDVELQKNLVLDGYGFTALPIAAVEEELKEGKLVLLSQTAICHENLWLIAAHRLVHNPTAQRLLKSFRP